MTDLTLNAESANIETTYNSRQVEITLNNVDLPSLLEKLELDDIIQHFGALELLDQLVQWSSRAAILDHLGVEEAP